MKSITINAEPRQDLGKKGTKALRKKGFVPCVIYGGNEVVHFTAHENTFRNIVYTPDFQKVDISIDGKVHSALLKDLQFHPVTDKLLHLDFQELVQDRPIIADIPVKLTGLAEGVKAGGKLMSKLRKVRVKATPDKLVDEISLDVSHLELGKSVRVRDIKLDGVEFVSSLSLPIATVEITRALRAAQAASGNAGANEAAEGANEE